MASNDTKLIYAADDEENIREILGAFLQQAGYRVMLFETGDALYDQFLKEPSDMVILDIMMPGTNGIDICKQIRSISKVPIIMLTAKESEMDYSIGITSGSDDYMIKPFSPSILMMRIKALFRRIDLERESAKENVIENLSSGDISYSESRHAIICDNKNLGLTEMELDFLKYMLKRSDEAISREDFLNDLWGLDSDTETRVVDETVRRLRRKLRQAQSRVTINTVWGYGYQLGEVL